MPRARIVTHPVHGECLYLDNGIVEIGVPLSFGIRIAHFSLAGEENIFFVQPKDMTRFTNDKGWRLRGGHRLWLAPESDKDYNPDNEPIAYEAVGDAVRFTQQNDPVAHVVKSMEVTLKGNAAEITHRITNTGDAAMKVALWALSVVNNGGVTAIPLPEREGGFDPLVHISAWDYTDLGDSRLLFGKKEIKVASRKGERKLKIGVGHPAGAIEYENGGTVFRKHVPFRAGGEYPDGGVSFEIYVSDYMTELEGLSPLYDLLPGETAAYTEVWELFKKTGV